MESKESFYHFDQKNVTYNNIKSHSIFNISEKGNIYIKGTIGKGACINKSGIGNLFINATVEKNVSFNLSGLGIVSFIKKPPEDITINKSGFVKIVIGGKELMNDIFPEYYARNKHYSPTRSNLVDITQEYDSFSRIGLDYNTQECDFIKSSEINDNNYSPSTKDYIESFKYNEKNTDLIKKLDLTMEEENLLEKYCDPITLDIINIPVILNERIYDLNTLLDIHKNNKEDPFNKYKFILRDIQSDRKTAEEIKEIIQQIVKKRKTIL